MPAGLNRHWAASIGQWVANRIKLRIREKRGPMTPPFELEYRHIYVLPTVFGWGFGLMLIFMALGGLNFNNNMALILVFLLGTIAQLTTLIAYRNLSGLRLERISSDPVFCGEDAVFRIFVSNNNERQKFAVQAAYSQVQDCKDFDINGRETYLLRSTTHKRGWFEMPSFKLVTRYPLGLFKAWSWVFPNNRCLVYPMPAKNAPPLPKTGRGQSGPAIKGDGDDVFGLRKYKTGDSMQRVAWRASARQGELYSMEMEAPQEDACDLDWQRLQGSNVETRLSILTAWVIAADAENIAYSLTLPDERFAAGKGPEHRARCLEKLALFSS